MNDDIYFIHASAVSFRNIGIIFSGPNESGKSSLLRSLLSHNASYLSDDACLIRSNSKKTIIIPNPESITCLEMSSDETESLLKRGFDFANDDRFLMPPINFQESVELNFIFFPEIVEVKQKIVSLTKKEAALKLLKSVKTPLSKKAQVKWFKFVCDICETTNFAKLFIERNSTFNTEEIINYCELLSS
ncbi:MAG TPA: hypothetical protein PLN69_05610 [bacterium]|nr:hypothetical protein [bacterium]